MKKLLFAVSVSLFFIPLLFSAVSSKAQSCTNSDNFESATLGATSFTSGGYTFNIISHVSTFNISDDDQSGFGWNGTSADNQFIDNNDAEIATPLPNTSFSIKSTSGPFSVKNFWIYPDSSGFESIIGSVTFTGKLAGTTIFTVTLDSTYFNSNASVDAGYTYIDFSTTALGDNISKTIDELEITGGGSCNYIGIDEFVWGAMPNITTQAATSVVSNGATLNGTVNADNLSTTNAFSYSTSSTLSSGVVNVAASPSPVTGSSSTSISAAITGLSSSTTYYYRANGTNCNGTAPGAILSFTTSAPVAVDYYSNSSGNLDATATWSTNTNGTGGSHPSDFTTVLQTFHIANSNAGNITGSNWTVSGTSSKIAIDAGTDLEISNSKPINATINVGAGRKLTISNSTLPALGTLNSTSTIDYHNLSNLTTLFAGTYGNVIFDGTTCSPSTAQAINISGTLTLQNSAVINNIGTINISGTTLSNMGTIAGAGSVSMTGAATQTVSGTGSISNLQINNAIGVTIASASTDITVTGTLTMTSGTLTTNGNLTLSSTASGTARIAAISSGSISGNVNVQQYIPGGERSFRFLGHPFSTAISLGQLASSIDITGTGGSTNGFTNTITNNPSAFWYNPLTGDGSTTDDVPGWVAFTNTTSTSGNNSWEPKEGIRILIRGTAGQGLDGNTYTPNATTLKLTGPVNQGTVTETMQVGSGSGYNLLSNPYPSPTDIGTVIHNAGSSISGSAFWMWDATQGLHGAYVAQTISATPYYLPANASFMVDAAVNNSVLTFNESNKHATASASLFRTTDMNNGITLHIYDTSMHSWDRLYISFNNKALELLENFDARKLHNADLDFYSLSSDNQRLCIDARPYVAGQIIPLGIATDVPQTYIIKAEDFTLPAGTQLYLHDKYLNQYQQLQSGSQYTFTITADSASQGNNRFELSLDGSTTGVASVAGANGLKVNMMPNPATGQVTISYEAAKSGYTTLRILNVTGQSVISMTLGDNEKGSVIVPLHNITAGIYFVELTCGTQTVTQRLVKQ